MSTTTDFIDKKKLASRISELQGELEQLLELQKLVGGTKAKRGRPAKAGGTGTGNPGKRTKKRGKLGESILKFLSTKGKEGAHVKDIAAAVKAGVPNVTAWFYSTGKNKTKKVKPATFALKG